MDSTRSFLSPVKADIPTMDVGAGFKPAPTRSPFSLFLITLLLSILANSSLYAQSLRSEETLAGEIRELELLKQRDLPSYRETIDSRREKIRHHLQEWREKKQDRLGRFLKRERELKQIRLRQMKQNRPEFYHRFREKRLDKMERFANHPRFKAEFENYQEKLQERHERNRSRPTQERGRVKAGKQARARKGHGW